MHSTGTGSSQTGHGQTQQVKRRIAGSRSNAHMKPWRLVGVLLAGGLVALSLPPWGWWPFAFFGVAIFVALGKNIDRPIAHLVLGMTFAIGWFAPGMAWMWFLTAPGYISAVTLYAVFHGLAALICSTTSRRTFTGPLLHALAEALRFSFPFGGVPLASLAIGQADSPFATLARLGGPLLLTWFVFQIGYLLSRPRFRRSVAALAIILGLVFISSQVPNGSETGVTLRVAAVQGGGPQGTQGINTNSRDVVERHLIATQSIAPSENVDVVIWPENVIDVAQFSTSPELDEITTEARRLNAPFMVGITEDFDARYFINAQVVVQTDGSITDRYDKVKRVPFGEFMPFRSILKRLGAPVHLVPRDALAGTGLAVLDIDGVRMAVAISWEDFFAGRVREGIQHGAQVIINPTNGASYTGTILQSQQIGASRLRAIENGRWLVQIATTGFSGVISPDGSLYERTNVSEQRVIYYDIPLRSGSTPYSKLGDRPLIFIMLVLTVGLILVGSRRKKA